MKKYFIKGTDKEVQYGDTIKVTNSKLLLDGRTMKKCIECKLTPVTLDMLLEEGFIEEREVKEEKGIEFHFEDNEPMCEDECPLTCIIDAIEALGEQVDTLTKTIQELKQLKQKK